MQLKSAFFIVVLVAGFCHKSTAQQELPDTGKIAVIQDKAIADFAAKQLDLNGKISEKGYRIKIHFGADKMKAKEVKAKFIARFPGVPAYEKYDQPNFNIRVGDFRTKLEAYKFLKEIQSEFPSSFIVQDEIEWPVLSGNSTK